MIILDSDVVSGAMRAEPSIVSWLDRQPPTSVWTTAITVLEIRHGLAAMAAGRRRSEREDAFSRLISDKLQNHVLAFDRAAAEETAALMGRRRTAGRPRDYRDSMIAGIALAQRAALATGNVRDFDDLPVPVIDPWSE